MIDLGVSKLALIAVVALIVVGPERLPKVARVAGNLFGRAQRYMSEVKSEVNRQMEMEEFRKIREESTAVLKEVENSIHSTAQQVTTHLSDQADLGLASSTDFDAVPNEQDVIQKTRRQCRNSWANKRAAKPLWFKRSSAIRARVQSGAARMKRFHHSASK